MKSEFVGEGLPAVDFAADEKAVIKEGGTRRDGQRPSAGRRTVTRVGRWIAGVPGGSRSRHLPHRVEIAVPMFGYKSLQH
jgi:hypothetical protein